MQRRNLAVLGSLGVLIAIGWVCFAAEPVPEAAPPGRFRMHGLVEIYTGAISSSTYVAKVYIYDTCTGEVRVRGKRWCEPVEPACKTVGKYQDLHVDSSMTLICDTTTGEVFRYDREKKQWAPFKGNRVAAQ